MLSPKQAAQPNPSYPALCRQDTTSPWSTDHVGNSQTLVHFLSGTAPARFASKVPSWRLPVSGHAAGPVTADPRVADDGGAGGFWTRKEKISTKQKTPCTPRGFRYSISATVVEEVASCGAFSCFHC